MKIDKMLKVKKRKEQALFNLWEVIVVCLAVSAVLCVITGYVVYIVNDTNILYANEEKDIIDTYQKIKENYYEDVDMKEISEAAIDGMMDYLNEKYSIYMDNETSSELVDKLSGNYKGIGVTIAKYKEGDIVVLTVYDDTPASEAGLRKGDIIKQMNGKKVTKETTTEELTEIIQTEKKITMLVERDKKEIKVSLSAKTMDYPVVESTIFEYQSKKIGYLYLSTFSSSAAKQVSKSLKRMENEGIESLIIDVRSNSGGYLNSADDIASLFLKKGKTIYSLEAKNERNVVVDKTEEERNYPIAVLMNGSTASASEILAGALKESYGAILVGTKSYGKGKVQQTSKLSHDTMIKYTTAKWFTPSGNSIDGIGLTPGIEISLSTKYAENPSFSTDDQLQKALQILANN